MKPFFREMDEMEVSINFRALRVVHLYTLLFLLVWLICIYICSGFNIDSVVRSYTFIFLLSILVVQFGARRIITAKINKGGKNEK